MGRLIFLDSVVLIDAMDGLAQFQSAARSRLAQGQFHASELVVTELLVGPLKRLIPLPRYEKLLSDLVLHPVDGQVLRRAAELRALYGLKTPDAIHAATALKAGATEFVTRDPAFGRVPGLVIVAP